MNIVSKKPEASGFFDALSRFLHFDRPIDVMGRYPYSRQQLPSRNFFRERWYCLSSAKTEVKTMRKVLEALY